MPSLLVRHCITFSLALLLVWMWNATAAQNPSSSGVAQPLATPELPPAVYLPLMGFASLAQPLLETGPLVGAVSDSIAVVMARASFTSPVRLVYSTDPLFVTNIFSTEQSLTLAANDYTVRVPLLGLQPATTYYYKVVVNGQPYPVTGLPRFTTFPLTETVTNFSFAVVSDLSSDPTAHAQAYASAANDAPAFVLQTGDFDHSNPATVAPLSIENWQVMHRNVLHDMKSGQDFAHYLGPAFPFFHIWDDHDYGANNADRTAPWKDLATQAFREYYPLPPLPEPESGLWYSFRYAQAEFFLLDLRSQRDPDDWPDGPNHSMLDGADLPVGQKKWLKASLLASTARWKFIISSSVWNPHSKQADSWYQFQYEQNELVSFIRNNNITGVIILSGDLHSGGAIDDGANSYFPELSVPTTNIDQQGTCTGDFCGTWSVGLIDPANTVPSGYALVTVLTNTVTLQAKGQAGDIRLEYTVRLP